MYKKRKCGDRCEYAMSTDCICDCDGKRHGIKRRSQVAEVKQEEPADEEDISIVSEKDELPDEYV